MTEFTVGFGAGVVGGLIKLLIDQITFAINISNVNTSGAISQIFYGTEGKLPLISWGIYIVITGIAGAIITKIISRKAAANFLFSGVITGVVLWIIMNVIFMVTGIITPTWSLGISSFIVNLLSHIVLGIVVIYAISKTKVERDK
jgi:hypothetical protein